MSYIGGMCVGALLIVWFALAVHLGLFDPACKDPWQLVPPLGFGLTGFLGLFVIDL